MENLEALAAHCRTIERLISLLDAIRSVAKIAWRRAEQGFDPLRQYSDRLQQLFRETLLGLAPEQRQALLHAEAEGQPIALLFVTAERGLCGPFTDHLVAQGLQHARKLSTQGQTVRLLCLGSRGRRLLEAAGHQLLYAKPLPSLAVPTYVDIEEIALDLLDLCEQRAFGRLLVVHNAPVRRFQYGATVRRLLPPDLAMPERPLRARIVVKPADDMPALLTHLLTEHCLLGLYEAVIASAISEQLARMYTMRLATENARKLLDKLTFDYNLTRSYAVTNSLLEIVAGYTATTEQ
ncbi:MAG TPA: FoF1 ATP synthase subunit gamma [Methylomirabilota bacterium]|nr:FoF1 ATP synthase subunit gamma [Methylomirabilota bacterium]